MDWQGQISPHSPDHTPLNAFFVLYWSICSPEIDSCENIHLKQKTWTFSISNYSVHVMCAVYITVFHLFISTELYKCAVINIIMIAYRLALMAIHHVESEICLTFLICWRYFIFSLDTTLNLWGIVSKILTIATF